LEIVVQDFIHTIVLSVGWSLRLTFLKEGGEGGIDYIDPQMGTLQMKQVRPAGFFHYPSKPSKQKGLMTLLSNENATISGTCFICGEGGIRTLDTVTRITVFETVPFNHSGTSPMVYN
jgi:hypothetical protein